MARITVFGSSGDLGTYLKKELQEKNHIVHAFDRLAIDNLINTKIQNDNLFLESDAFIFSIGSFKKKSIKTLKLEEIENEVESNLTLLIKLTSIICSRLYIEKKINFIYIGSTSAYRGFANTATYCAAKFGLRGFVESMNAEYANSQIKFSLVSMGTLKSRMGSTLEDQNPDTFIDISTVGDFVINSALMLKEAYISEAIIMRRQIEYK